MSARSTGAKAVHFEYYTEFDEIFGADPNIEPVTTASSSRTMSREEINTIFNMTPQLSTETFRPPQPTDNSNIPSKKKKQIILLSA